MKKIFIATPAYEGKNHVQYTVSIVETIALFSQYNIQCALRLSAGGSLLCAERNRLITQFLETDCTHIFFIDSDLGWNAQSALFLLMCEEDFVAGVYPCRGTNSFTFRPFLNEDRSVIVNPEKKLLKMQYIPAGFMLIKREVIEKAIKSYPNLKYTPKDGSSAGYALFNTELIDEEFWGEDYVFCKRIREIGIDIWVYPEILFDHAGKIGAMTSVLVSNPD